MIEKIKPAREFIRLRPSYLPLPLTSLLIGILIFCSLMLESCNMGNGNQDDGQAAILYDKSVRLITAYTDSMSRAADTIAIQQLSERFEQQLDRLNNNVPAETDLRMSEGQNDTLAYLVEKWIQTRDKSLKKATGVIEADSIAAPADTLKATTQSVTTAPSKTQ